MNQTTISENVTEIPSIHDLCENSIIIISGVMGALLAISEILAFVPVKSNSIFQLLLALLFNASKMISKTASGKYEYKPDPNSFIGRVISGQDNTQKLLDHEQNSSDDEEKHKKKTRKSDEDFQDAESV
jgi:hypothetical protein